MLAETAGTRAAFDDVDDYSAWTESPPQRKDGSVLSDLAEWRRDVSVDLVRPANPGLLAISDQGVKRITVSVYRNGKLLGSLTALRTGKPDSTLNPVIQ